MPINLLSSLRILLSAVVAVAACVQVSNAQSTSTESVIKKTTEPVFRVSKLTTVEADSTTPRVQDEETAKPPKARIAMADPKPESKSPTVSAPVVVPHPLDRALSLAKTSLARMQSNIDDYTAVLAKRERVNGEVGKTTFMKVKVRCPRTLANGQAKPFSVYMKFLKPREALGREVIWVDGENDGKLLAHDGSGLGKYKTFKLNPTGLLAMRGQRYPVYSVGIENLIIKLIEKAERDRAAGDCVATYNGTKTINKRKCSVIEVIHDEKKAPFEFYKAMVFIDDEMQIPVRYAAYDWPTQPGAEPSLIEEYTYFNIKTNVGLTSEDFDPANKTYQFPGYKK